ncbi:MAG: hypothetical protein ABI761_17745 [Saprospiraceae bacterium]
MHYSEFYDRAFIHQNYVFRFPSDTLKPYIDFFWESDYDPGLQPFTIRSFPRIGSTLLFNIKGKFKFCKGGSSLMNEENIYYSRNQIIDTTHQADSKIFGVQFKINLPLIGNPGKSASHNNIFTANHLFAATDNSRIIASENFDERIVLCESIILNRLTKKTEYMAHAVNSVISNATITSPAVDSKPGFIPHSTKTIERYFKSCTGTSPQKAIRIQKTRMALQRKLENKTTFNCIDFGFYDESHFYKCVHNLKSGY